MRRNLGTGALFILGIWGLSSCEDDTTTIRFDAIGDTYVQKIKIDDKAKYGIQHYAYANMQISKATLTTPGNDEVTIELKKDEDDYRRFSKVTELEDFVSEMPVDGEYTYTIISNDQDTIQSTDMLLPEEIPAVQIEDFTYNQEEHSFNLSWNDIDEADLYLVKLMEERNGKVLFVSPKLIKSEFEFNTTSIGWLNGVTMENSKNYVLGVSAYKFENSKTQSGYDIQMECVDYREINW